MFYGSVENNQLRKINASYKDILIRMTWKYKESKKGSNYLFCIKIPNMGFFLKSLHALWFCYFYIWNFNNQTQMFNTNFVPQWTPPSPGPHCNWLYTSWTPLFKKPVSASLLAVCTQPQSDHITATNFISNSWFSRPIVWPFTLAWERKQVCVPNQSCG